MTIRLFLLFLAFVLTGYMAITNGVKPAMDLLGFQGFYLKVLIEIVLAFLLSILAFWLYSRLILNRNISNNQNINSSIINKKMPLVSNCMSSIMLNHRLIKKDKVISLYDKRYADDLLSEAIETSQLILGLYEIGEINTPLESESDFVIGSGMPSRTKGDVQIENLNSISLKLNQILQQHKS